MFVWWCLRGVVYCLCGGVYAVLYVPYCLCGVVWVLLSAFFQWCCLRDAVCAGLLVWRCLRGVVCEVFARFSLRGVFWVAPFAWHCNRAVTPVMEITVTVIFVLQIWCLPALFPPFCARALWYNRSFVGMARDKALIPLHAVGAAIFGPLLRGKEERSNTCL